MCVLLLILCVHVGWWGVNLRDKPQMTLGGRVGIDNLERWAGSGFQNTPVKIFYEEILDRSQQSMV